MATKTLKETISLSDWTSNEFLESKSMLNLFGSGIISKNTALNGVLNTIDMHNVPSVVHAGVGYYEKERSTIGEIGGVDAIPQERNQVTVKTQYKTKVFVIHDVEKDLMDMMKPIESLVNYIGDFWAREFNEVIGATLSGLTTIGKITVGTGAENLDRSLMLKARNLKGMHGFNNLSKMYMSSGTQNDILNKQYTKVIEPILFPRPAQLGITTSENNIIIHKPSEDNRSAFVYDTGTEIILDNTIKDGIICMVDNGAFAFAQKNLTNPFTIGRNTLANGGLGVEFFTAKCFYVIHPVGFSFKATKGNGFAKDFGLTLEEFKAGNLYELKNDISKSPIINIKVKMGK